MSPGPQSDDSVIRTLFESTPLPHDDGMPVFNAPWQARAFGLAVALNRLHGVYEWREFQERLVDEIGRSTADASADARPADVEDAYYESWLAALERLLVEEAHVTPEELQQRAAEFEAHDRTAAEFVEGEHEH